MGALEYEYESEHHYDISVQSSGPEDRADD